MQYEFRGRTLREAVHNAIERKDSRKCETLKAALERRNNVIANSTNRLRRLERAIEALKDEIENDKESLDHDDIDKALRVVAALVGLVPAVRAVRLGLGAVWAGATVVQAIRSGAQIDDAVLSVISGMGSISLLTTPSPRRKLERLISEVANEMDNIRRWNQGRSRILNEMEKNVCSSTSV